MYSIRIISPDVAIESQWLKIINFRQIATSLNEV